MKVRLRESDYENYDYREFWDKGKRAYEDRSERIALRDILKDVDRENIFMDLGCGYGRLFSEYSDFKNIILVDYSLKNLKIAKDNIGDYLKSHPDRPGSVFFIAADATRMPISDSTIDIIMTVRMLHHIGEPERYLDEVKRILKPDSLYFLEYANKRNSKNILKFFIRRSKVSPFDKRPLKIGETILNFHPAYIKSSLLARGFDIKKRISVSNFRSGSFKRIFGLNILNFLERSYQSLIPGLLLGPSVFLKMSLGDEPKKDRQKVSPGFDVISILICPCCKKNKLERSANHLLECKGCLKKFTISDGLIDLRNEKAK